METNTKPCCGECGKEISGRQDKRFCNDYCRNLHNNHSKSGDNKLIRPLVNILKKNRAILTEVMAKSQYHIVEKERLLEMGYNFRYCTEHKTMNGYDYYFCFNIGYVMEQQGQCKIMSRDYFDFISKPLPLWVEQLSFSKLDDPATKKLRTS